MAIFNIINVTNGYPGFGNLEIIGTSGAVLFDSFGSLPFQFSMDGNLICGIGTTGVAIGLGTTPASRQLDVASSALDIARFYGSRDLTDIGVRITTDQPNSTAGLILEQQAGDSAGGIRIDNMGNVSIHAGENMFSQLSNSSARITILPLGMVGFGTNAPQNNLHVVGGIRLTTYTDIDPIPTVLTGTLLAVQIDGWLLSEYRTARYTVQVTNPVTDDIDVTEVVLTHSNGVPYMSILSNINSNGSLGTLGADTDGDEMQFTITNLISNLVVKLSAEYITL